MSDKFFVRGNLALDWEHVLAIMPTCYHVCVDMNGIAYLYDESYPRQLKTIWSSDGSRCLAGRVGEECPDWRELIFTRPEPPRLPDGFWEAVDVIYGKSIMFVATKEEYSSNDVAAYEEEQHAINHTRFVENTFYTKRPYTRIGQTKAD